MINLLPLVSLAQVQQATKRTLSDFDLRDHSEQPNADWLANDPELSTFRYIMIVIEAPGAYRC